MSSQYNFATCTHSYAVYINGEKELEFAVADEFLYSTDVKTDHLMMAACRPLIEKYPEVMKLIKKNFGESGSLCDCTVCTLDEAQWSMAVEYSFGQTTSVKPNLTSKPAAPKKLNLGSTVGRSKIIDSFPGIHEMVKHPVDGHMDDLESVIISLNDEEQWTREQIADWLETLDIDIRFKPKETSGSQ